MTIGLGRFALSAAAGSGVTGDLLAHCIDTAIWLNGMVSDVTTHPAFRQGAQTIAELYDMKADPTRQDLLSFEEDGERFSLYWLRCRNRDDLARARPHDRDPSSHTVVRLQCSVGSALRGAIASIGERLKSTGQVINVGGPKEFADAIEEQRANVEKTVKAIDFKPKQ